MADISKFETITSQKLYVFVIDADNESVFLKNGEPVELEITNEQNPRELVEDYFQVVEGSSMNIISKIDIEVFKDFWCIDAREIDYEVMEDKLKDFELLKMRDMVVACQDTTYPWLILAALDPTVSKPLGGMDDGGKTDAELIQESRRAVAMRDEEMRDLLNSEEYDKLLEKTFDQVKETGAVFTIPSNDVHDCFKMSEEDFYKKVESEGLKVEKASDITGVGHYSVGVDDLTIGMFLDQAGMVKCSSLG